MKWLYKILFTIANAVIILFGLGLAAIGSIMTKDEEGDLFEGDDISTALGQQVKPYSYIILCFGAGLAIVGTIGMVSILCNIKLLGNVYVILLFVMAILVLIGGVLTFNGSAYLRSTRRGEMILMMDGKLDRKLMDKIELEYKCCGVRGQVRVAPGVPSEAAYAFKKLPASCCGKNDPAAPCPKEKAYEARCDEMFTSGLHKLMYDGGLVMFAGAVYLFAVTVLAAISLKQERPPPNTE